MKNFLIVGASRGLGAAFSAALPSGKDTVWVVSRTKPRFGTPPGHIKRHWIKADLRHPQDATRKIARAIGIKPVHVFIYNAGIWEDKPFDRVRHGEIADIINVNLHTAILCVRALSKNLRLATGQIILIGSTCGIENEGTEGVVYAASKFGIRGATHALREYFRQDWVRVTCISPGSIASDIPYKNDPSSALTTHSQRRMPVEDLVALVQCVLALSPATCVKEVVVPATADIDV